MSFGDRNYERSDKGTHGFCYNEEFGQFISCKYPLCFFELRYFLNFLISKAIIALFCLLQGEVCNIRELLLSDFLPDYVCPLGSQFITDTSEIVHQPNEKNDKNQEEVIAYNGNINVWYVKSLTCVSSDYAG